MFRTLIYASSGGCDGVVELPDELQDDRCGNSTTQLQAPDDGYINVRNMLGT